MMRSKKALLYLLLVSGLVAGPASTAAQAQSFEMIGDTLLSQMYDWYLSQRGTEPDNPRPVNIPIIGSTTFRTTITGSFYVRTPDTARQQLLQS